MYSYANKIRLLDATRLMPHHSNLPNNLTSTDAQVANNLTLIRHTNSIVIPYDASARIFI